MHHLARYRWFSLLVLGFAMVSPVRGSSMNGRHSFSLTTFDPTGKLGQVERAMEAAAMGTPIVAIINEKTNGILLAAPQILPSVFMVDDGTARFSSVAPHIAMTHSGISADGRVLIAAAQRLAVEHSYTFEEAIPIDLLLEEMSLLLQEYTMKPGSRPFGSTLLVAHLPSAVSGSDPDQKPQLFRIDPSGSVTLLEDGVAVINGKVSEDTKSKLKELASQSTTSKKIGGDDLKQLCDILQDSISPKVFGKMDAETVQLPSCTLGVSFTPKNGLRIQRY
ncbi:unnamed protein product [Cylindrotheca closterium]|uniref:Proteasome alpha-type subunits domain-containing protein n=1 Tax=Cylindrotheca closterium TaxID=2856 RepID=A0AAD2FYA4_9STRA|nr:unnamed protein product [Cylindrotheca closterium]